MKVQTYEQVFGKPLTVRELVDGFSEDTKTGKVIAFGGKLNVRPPYQREFIYDNERQRAVIDTVMKNYPLNVMYWAKCEDGTYELMDGQQRTLSLCIFYDGRQTIDTLENGKVRHRSFYDFDKSETERFLNYPLTVYICDGDESDKLGWFRVINVAGVKLTEQEMRNAIYTSAWVTDAKRYFSNPKGAGYLSEGIVSNDHIYGDYVDVVTGDKNSENAKSISRQYLLEIVLSWATDKYNRDNQLAGKEAKNIDDYMRIHKTDGDARELWRYYEDVMEWVKKTFPTYRPVMKKVEWGVLYNEFHNVEVSDADDKANVIFNSGEASNEKEIYRAVLEDDMKYIHARSFNDADKKWAYKKQGGYCVYCHQHFDNYKEMQGDHIVPWSKGGKTDRDNLQMLCPECNIKKSAHDVVYKPWDNTSYESFDLEKWSEEIAAEDKAE